MNTNRKSNLYALIVFVAIVVLSVVAAWSLSRNSEFPTVDAMQDTVVALPVSHIHSDYSSRTTNPVSITCRTRNHFEYHNEDKTVCGFGDGQKVNHMAEVVVVESDEPVHSTTITPDVPVIDDGGVCIENCVVVDDDDNTSVSDDDNTSDDDSDADVCDKANPGNKKCKGNATEDPNNKGTMVQDDPAKENGEHGNQGQNGNSADTTNGNNGKGKGNGKG